MYYKAPLTDIKYFICLIFDFHSKPRNFETKVLLKMFLTLPCVSKLAGDLIRTYWVVQKLPHIYTANHATFPIQKRTLTVQICGNFWGMQYFIKVLFASITSTWSLLSSFTPFSQQRKQGLVRPMKIKKKYRSAKLLAYYGILWLGIENTENGIQNSLYFR